VSLFVLGYLNPAASHQQSRCGADLYYVHVDVRLGSPAAEFHAASVQRHAAILAAGLRQLLGCRRQRVDIAPRRHGAWRWALTGFAVLAAQAVADRARDHCRKNGSPRCRPARNRSRAIYAITFGVRRFDGRGRRWRRGNDLSDHPACSPGSSRQGVCDLRTRRTRAAYPGALVGGLALGLLESFGAYTFVRSGVRRGFAVMLLVLTIRPNGFGRTSRIWSDVRDDRARWLIVFFLSALAAGVIVFWSFGQ